MLRFAREVLLLQLGQNNYSYGFYERCCSSCRRKEGEQPRSTIVAHPGPDPLTIPQDFNPQAQGLGLRAFIFPAQMVFGVGGLLPCRCICWCAQITPVNGAWHLYADMSHSGSSRIKIFFGGAAATRAEPCWGRPGACLHVGSADMKC